MSFTEQTYMHDRVKNFLEIVSSNLPGCLIVFDFADFKRRNSHLGQSASDKDIKDFESILNRTLSKSDPWVRIAGDKWAVFTSENSIGKIKTIIRSFARSDKVRVGWICKATLNGKLMQNETNVITDLIRAIRCAYMQIPHHQSLDQDLEMLMAYVGKSQINIPQEYNTKPVEDQQRWCCITYPQDKQVCVFCGNEDLEHIGDAFGPILSSESICKRCNAHLEIQEVFETLNQHTQEKN
jgi:GGDEF domain-containing protein